MHILELSDGNGLFYIYTPPRDEHGKTYVFSTR